ncbi:helix-turn-helix domain-containing protein [Levilactobacillus cerevisiae]
MNDAITVTDLLGHSVFQNSDTFSDSAGLSHEVGTCTIMDIPNIMGWLNANDVVIIGEYTDNCLTSEFISSLHHKQIACLITKKKYRPNFTKEIIHQFSEYHIPIILVTDNYAWSAVIRAVQQLQFGHYQKIIDEKETFYQSLIRSSVNHSAHESLGSTFNVNTGASLAIVDQDKNLVDASFDVDWVSLLPELSLSDLQPNQSITKNDNQLFGHLLMTSASFPLATVWSIPVYYRRQLRYYLLVGLQTPTKYLPENLLVKLESVKKVMLIKEELRQDFIYERFFKVNEAFQAIASHTANKEADFITLQSFAGIQLQQHLQVIQISSLQPSDSLFENNVLAIQASLAKLIRHSFPGITIYHNRSWLVLTSASKSALTQDLSSIMNQLDQAYPDIHFRAGVSQRHEFSRLKKTLTEANGALSYLRANHPNQQLQFFDQLGINQLFIDNDFHLNKAYITTMVTTFMTPLVNYDQEHHTELVKTLGCYFRHQFSHTQTSTDLFIHKNTLRNRLAKIEELIGPSHEDFWLNLQISYRLYQQIETA